MRKPTKFEHERRVDEVFGLLTAGLTRGQILSYVEQKTDWKVCPRTVDSYVAKATERFREAADVDRAVLAGKALARLDELYARALRIQDYKTCLAIQRELDKLLGFDVRWPALAKAK